jgi:hypothetical protein
MMPADGERPALSCLRLLMYELEFAMVERKAGWAVNMLACWPALRGRLESCLGLPVLAGSGSFAWIENGNDS